jgi:RND family efflux transporter MFP subunit
MNIDHRITAALLAMALVAGCGEQAPPAKEIVRPVRAMQIGDSTDFDSRSFPGTAKATHEANLSFRVSGPLIERPVFVGDEMKAGDTLAQIDPTDFQVEQRNAEALLERATANKERATLDLDRLERIRKQDPGAASEVAIDKARDNLNQAKADVSARDATVEAARNALRYTTLKAPFDGTVVATYVENFEFVRARERVIRLLDTTRIEFVVNLPESLISYAPYVRNIKVVFDSYSDHPVAAEIKEIGTEASQTTRTYPVNLIMDQPEGFQILPGMAGRATGAVDLPAGVQLAQGLTVPVTAVFSPHEDDKTYVWIFDPDTDTVSSREVKTEALTEAGIRIVEGLENGEWVATAGANYLQEGQKVKLLGKDDES